jgi:[methyl-Co(III) methanol-specific corrinoid protein]:coenzyme M methyltransferase
MKPRDIFLAKLRRQTTPRAATGSATSVVTTDLMDAIGVAFPAAHLDAERMAVLAEAGHTRIGFDNVMPLFSVWHESSALGCRVDWSDRHHLPTGQPYCPSIDTPPAIPGDLLMRPGCAVPLEAIRLLKRRLGGDSAVVGKVFGPWTPGPDGRNKQLHRNPDWFRGSDSAGRAGEAGGRH